MGKQGPNGGNVVVSDGHPVELVASASELTFFIRDGGGQAMDTRGMSARAIVQDGGKAVTVTLSPIAPNRFVGALAVPIGAGGRVVFSTRAHGHSLQARFEPR